MLVTRKRPSLNGTSQVPRCERAGGIRALDVQRRKRAAGGGEPLAARRIEREIDAQHVVQPLDRLLLARARRIRRRQRVDGKLARDRDHVVEARLVEREAAHQADRQRRDHQNDRDGEVDLEIKPLHGFSFCA